MQLPFTTEQFFEILRLYNSTLWPAQVFLGLLAVLAIIFSSRFGAHGSVWQYQLSWPCSGFGSVSPTT